jgi:hypothetical protein
LKKVLLITLTVGAAAAGVCLFTPQGYAKLGKYVMTEEQKDAAVEAVGKGCEKVTTKTAAVVGDLNEKYKLDEKLAETTASAKEKLAKGVAGARKSLARMSIRPTDGWVHADPPDPPSPSAPAMQG